MSKIQCIIVDDEPLARRLVEKHVKRLPNWQVKATCKNALEAYEILMSNVIDVLFLDINMPVVDGTDFYRSLKNPPLLIFTTAYPDYAVEGFELDALDYLVKPITFDRFLKAANRAKERLKTRQKETNKSEKPPKKINDFIFIKHLSKLVKVSFKDILYLEAQKDYVKFVTDENEMLAGMTMKLAEEQLPEILFIRIHRSYIISIDAVTAMFGNIIEIGGVQLPIGSTYKDVVMDRLNGK
jgi:DNA-binding LytR/AlgR family response regulator